MKCVMEYNKKLINRILVIIVLTIIMLAVNAIKSKSLGDIYITNEKGDLLGINTPNDDLLHEYKLYVINDDGQAVETRVNIDNRIKKEVKEIEKKPENIFEKQVLEITEQIDAQNSEKIILPNELENGDKIRWQVKNEKDYSNIIYIVIAVLLIIITIKSKDSKIIKEKELYKKEILSELPRFSNQLVLLLNSGLILNDCIKRIISNYKSEDDSNISEFKRDLIELLMESENKNENVILTFNRYANRIKIKELSRISMINIENLERGSDIREKIELESQYLWNMRKTIARENGKYIETKMTLPLGLLLLILVLVTMAPAIMNM
ncbi:MAG TPA: type II secretion system F family protein [Anaerovoracaceae bacterium]|nr:type II secretion system F family protein [Anaerovoracaceae bacterium]